MTEQMQLHLPAVLKRTSLVELDWMKDYEPIFQKMYDVGSIQWDAFRNDSYYIVWMQYHLDIHLKYRENGTLDSFLKEQDDELKKMEDTIKKDLKECKDPLKRLYYYNLDTIIYSFVKKGYLPIDNYLVSVCW